MYIYLFLFYKKKNHEIDILNSLYIWENIKISYIDKIKSYSISLNFHYVKLVFPILFNIVINN